MFKLPLNVWLLVTAQAFGSCGTIMVILVGSLAGAAIAPSPSLSTLPITAAILGTAVSTVPIALLMRRIGRRAGFLGGCWLAAMGSCVSAYAVYNSNFWLFVATMTLIGCNQAFILQYRFAAIESVSEAQAPHAVATLLLSTIVAAILGPEIGFRGSRLIADTPYVGSFLGLALMYVCSAAALLRFQNDTATISERGTTAAGASRMLHHILRHPRTLTAIGGAAIGYGVMTLLMTAAPISMHLHRGLSEDATKLALQMHVIAMFLPSLFTGRLVARYGEITTLWGGIACNLISVLIALHGDTAHHFSLALLSLGIGWNLLFIASTTLLAKCYQTHERHKVQATNDFIVFGFQAIASFSSGLLVNLIGWGNLAVAAAFPLLLLVGLIGYQKFTTPTPTPSPP